MIRRWAQRPPALQLLGEGLDDIVQHTCRVLKPEERLLRYVRAKHLAPPATRRDRMMSELRLVLGTTYRDAWSAGFYPNLRNAGRRYAAELREHRIHS